MTWDQKELAGYLVDVDTGERLQFQYNPSEITDEKGHRLRRDQNPRHEPSAISIRRAGEPRRIALRIGLFKGPVKKQVHWLRSLLYPEHAGTMLKNAPHRVLLIFGDLYPRRDLHRAPGAGAIFWSL